MNSGYNFYIDGLKLPVAPEKLEISIGSNNKVKTLINGGDFNILKSPSLIEISFDMRLPQTAYPWASDSDAEKYLNKLKDLKENKKSFRFIVTRSLGLNRLFDTNLLMALEEYKIKEDSDEGFDIIVEVELKQWKLYGTKVYTPSKTADTTGGQKRSDSNANGNSNTSYTIVSGDTLWAIAKKFYGDGSLWKKIYNANSNVIETTAKNRGMKSSSNGHWIFPNTKLVIPSK